MSFKRKGFTLIELMIAITIGTLVVYTAMVGVRVSASAVTSSNRLALENSLLRIGFIQAMNEVDFWVDSDNPDNNTKQPFRINPRNGLGGAYFSNFAQVTDPVVPTRKFQNTSVNLTQPAGGGVSGWNPYPLARSAALPRTWSRVNVVDETEGISGNNKKHYWGTSWTYSNLDRTKANHYWYAGQIRGLIDAVGFFGMYEYVPSNAFINYYGDSPLGGPNVMSWCGMTIALTYKQGNGGWFCPSDGGEDNNLKSRMRPTNGSRFALPGPPPHTVVLSEADRVKLCRKYYNVGYEGRKIGFDNSYLENFMNEVKVEDLNPSALPETWPLVSYEVRRFIERGHLVTSCVIVCTEPISGKKFIVPFTCVGTTLRGARQQRDPRIGFSWADPYTGPTLDYGVLP